jgi:hypothetical protein
MDAWEQSSFKIVAMTVARRLVKREVVIDWTRPTKTDADGLCFRLGKRVGIEIDPTLEGVDLLRVLLHELSHAALHADDYMSDRLAKKAAVTPPPANSILGRMKTNIHARREDEADAQADHWLKWAEANALSGRPLSKLLALRHYPGDG